MSSKNNDVLPIQEDNNHSPSSGYDSPKRSSKTLVVTEASPLLIGTPSSSNVGDPADADLPQLVVDEAHQNAVGGGKDISFGGGLALLVNSITGPGLVTIPVVFQQAGWFTPVVTMIIIMIISSLSATLLCETMALIPGNERFQGRIEFTSLSKYLFPRWGFYLTMLLLVLSLMAVLISSVIISAQTMDLAVLAIFKKTWALEFAPHPGWVEVTAAGNNVSPFGDRFVISLGYVIVLAITVPLGYFNLDDNIIVQNGAFGFLIFIFVEWFVTFFIKGIDASRISAFAPNQSQVLGTIIFNYAFVITVPSWINEKREGVGVNKSIWLATSISTVFYMGVGLFGALTFDFKGNEDLLDVINNETTGSLHLISRICVYMFPVAALLSSIPVFSIVIKYNLLDNDMCSKKVANFWAVVFPWIISVVFYTGAGLIEIINWASLFVNGFINFVIPMLLFIIAKRKRKRMTMGIQDEDEMFHAFPSWVKLDPITASIVMIVIVTILIVVVIVTDFVYLALGQSIV